MEAEEKSPTAFPLFDLPDELVVRITRYAVTLSSAEDPIEINNQKHLRHRLAQPPITRTCHFLRNEGLKLFFCNNVFLMAHSVASRRGLLTWLIQLSDRDVDSLSSFYFGTFDFIGSSWDFARSVFQWRAATHSPGRHLSVKVSNGKITLARQQNVQDWCQLKFSKSELVDKYPKNFTGWIDLGRLHLLPIDEESMDWYDLEEEEDSKEA